MTRLVLEPAVPASWLWTCGLLAPAAMAAYLVLWPPPAGARARRVIAALWLAGVGALLSLLANPTWVGLEPGPAGRPLVHVLIDTSASMATRDVGGQPRIEAARALARALEAGLSTGPRGVDLAWYGFAQDCRPLRSPDQGGLDARGPVTDLATPLLVALEARRRPMQAVILVTDGAHNRTPGLDTVREACRRARALQTAVHAVCLGGQVRSVDLAVELEAAEVVAWAGQPVPVGVRVLHRGIDYGTVRVEVHEGRRVMASQVARIRGPGPVELSFELPASRPGVHRYEIVATPRAAEAVLANNQRTFTLRVLDRPLRLLVLEGNPYWEIKFLARALLDDPCVELTWATRVAPGRTLVRSVRRRGPGAPQPRTEEMRVAGNGERSVDALLVPRALEQIDAVILGRGADEILTPASVAALTAWVSHEGGALVCARGHPGQRAADPLSALLPVVWDPGGAAPYQIDLAGLARALRLAPDAIEALGSNAPLALATPGRIPRAKDLSTVLARARGGVPSGAPVVAAQSYGLGRTLLLETAGLWRLALAPAARARQVDVHRALWLGLVRWLMGTVTIRPGQGIAVRAEKTATGETEPVRLDVYVRAPRGGAPAGTPEVRVRGPDGTFRDHRAIPTGIGPGVYTVPLGTLPPGRYEATARSTARPTGARATTEQALAGFEVLQSHAEALEPGARPDILELVTQETGGHLLRRPDVDALREACLASWAASHPTRHHKESAWDNSVVLVLVVALWGTLWVVRRLGGLV